MKFISTSNRVYHIESQDEYELLVGVKFIDKRKGMVIDDWGPYWIFEADEEYASWTMISQGWYPPTITDEEFRGLMSAGRFYFSKERTVQLRDAIFAMLPKTDK